MTNEPMFWEVVEVLGWGTKTVNPETCKQALSTLPPEQRQLLRNTYGQLHRKLSSFLSGWSRSTGNSFGLGDDGFSDLVAHIVGLGKEEYYATLEHPERALLRAHVGHRSAVNSRGFTESFGYCFQPLVHNNHNPQVAEKFMAGRPLRRARNNGALQKFIVVSCVQTGEDTWSQTATLVGGTDAASVAAQYPRHRVIEIQNGKNVYVAPYELEDEGGNRYLNWDDWEIQPSAKSARYRFEKYGADVSQMREVRIGERSHSD